MPTRKEEAKEMEEAPTTTLDGYEHGSIDSAYDMYDRGYAAAIDDYDIAWRRYYLENDDF
jgi:hypothetical protein